MAARQPLNSSPCNGPPGSLETVSFYSETRKIMTDICQFATMHEVRRKDGTSPFGFIARAATHFLFDPNRGLEAAWKRIDVTDKMTQTKLPETETQDSESELWSSSTGQSECYSNLHYLALQIINAAIGRCLELYDGVKLKQPPEFSPSEIPWSNTVEARAEFLRTLFASVLRQEGFAKEIHVGQVNNEQICDNPDFRYKEQLRSSLGEVRVATIAPGAKDDPVRCQLTVRDLNCDGLHETLSYVWGPGPASHTIRVDGKDFKVRDSLYCAFKTLRQPDTPREIWVDALCINQADTEERTGQVKLMQRIYAVSAKTTIWLGDEVPEIEGDFLFEDMEKSLSQWLDEPMVDENNLTSMLDLCRKFSSNLTTKLKATAHGRLTGEEGDEAADLYRILSRSAMSRNVLPEFTYVERSSREFLSARGMTIPMSEWFFGSTVKPPKEDSAAALLALELESTHIDGHLWAAKLTAAMVALCRCVFSVLSHSWWGRMWVIQESYLPGPPPEFYFRGSVFTWNDLVEAKNVAKEMILATNYSYFLTPQEDLDALSEDAKSFFHNSFVFSERMGHFESKTGLSFALRERKTRNEELPYWRVEKLVGTFDQTAPYKATDPVDKIFALESLLNPIMGHLMDLDYSRPVFEVFGKMTIQAATNAAEFGSLVKTFDFLADSKKQSGARQSWPSWVLDFTYSDAAQRRVDDAVVEDPTFEGALFSAANAIGDGWANDRSGASDNFFFAPKVLYCSGLCIPTGDAFSIQLAKPNADGSDSQWHGFRHVFRKDFKAFLSPYLSDPHLSNPFLKHLFMGGPPPDSSSLYSYDRYHDSGDESEATELRPRKPSLPLTKGSEEGPAAVEVEESVPDEIASAWTSGLNELWSLGYNRAAGAVWSISDPNRPPMVSLYTRGWECVGKHAMFLESGLTALTCVAHAKGDVLAMLCGTGVFLHLRPVEREGDGPAYRIVSRALVAGALKGNIDSVFERDGAYMRTFEIV